MPRADAGRGLWSHPLANPLFAKRRWGKAWRQMAIRRFTRLTNAFSKKLSHLKAAVALHFAYYNFCRIHSSLRITPAMEAGLADHVWSMEELLGCPR